MLIFIPYEKETEIQALPQISSTEKNYTVICPHPQLADHSRSFFSKSAQVLTISRFMKDQLQLAYPDKNLEQRGKAELLLFLSGVWRQQEGAKKLETFKQAFKLFTEFRSFTLDLHLIEEILPEFSPEVTKALRMFWLVTEELGLIDEHKAYALLSEAYRSLENPVNEKASIEGRGETYLFWGFRHLSSLQVDLLKALSLRHEIIIPLPKKIFSSLKPSDWPCWLGAQEEKQEELLEEKEIKAVLFSKGRLAETLARFDPPQGGDFLLCTEKPSLEQYAEIPFPQLQYRCAMELWKGDFEKLSQRLMEADDYEESLTELLQEGLEEKKFPQIKILLLFKELFNEWKSLSENHNVPAFFDRAIFREIVLLRLPRNFIFPIEKEGKGRIYSLRESETLKEKNPLWVCASSSYEDLKGGSEAYNPRVMEFLRAIGPIQRREFLFSFIKENLQNLLKKDNVILFFEEGLTEHMLCWSDVLKGFKLVSQSYQKQKQSPRSVDPLKERQRLQRIQSLSASSLQSYLDCPRKFYYTSIEKLKGRAEYESSLRTDELGSLEHRVIELYLKTEKNFDESKHQRLTREVLENYLSHHKKNLLPLEKESAYWEIKNCSQNGINSLLALKQGFPEMTFTFEKKLEGNLYDYPLKGSADCVIESPQGWALLDFKRSKNSIPSKKELEELNSLQLPFYLKHLFSQERNLLFWGHLSLTQINESQVFACDEIVRDRLLASLFLEDKKISCWSFPLDAYSVREKELIEKLNKDEEYAPLPREKETCLYCDLKNICPRGVLDENP